MRALTILLMMLFTTSICLAKDIPLKYIGEEKDSPEEVNDKETGDYLIQQKGDNVLYVVHEGKKYYLHQDMLEILEYHASSAKGLSLKEFESIPHGDDEWLEVRLEQILSNRFTYQENIALPKGLQEGSLIKREGDYMVYTIHHGRKYLVRDRKLAEERGYDLSEAEKLSPDIFDTIQEGDDNWFNDYLMTQNHIPKIPAREKYNPSYNEVFSYATNPYKEEHSSYNNPYSISSDQLYGGEFRRFEQKIFDNVRSNILSPRELEERKLAEEAAELNRRYIEAQIGGEYQQGFTQQAENFYDQPGYNQDYSLPTTETGTFLSSESESYSDTTQSPTSISLLPIIENGGYIGTW